MGTSYNPTIVTDGLTLCIDAANSRSYPGTGTTWTDLKGGQNGVLTNMDDSNFNTDNGGCLSFDGADEYAEFPSFTATAEATVTCRWRLPAGATSSNTTSHRMWRGHNNYEIRMSTYAASAGNGSGNGCWIGDVGGTRIWTERRNWDANVWYSLTLTNSLVDDFYKLYLDGVLVTSIAMGSYNPAGLGTEMLVGGRGVQSMVGDIASFFIYNRALTADEVRQNYEATVGRYS